MLSQKYTVLQDRNKVGKPASISSLIFISSDDLDEIIYL